MNAMNTLQKRCRCPVFADNVTRQLYATDASVYQVVPQAVAFPRDVQETSEVLAVASSLSLSLTPRGAGSGLAGGALGEGLVIDMSRYNRGIAVFNRDERSVRVGAGVVLDQLNDFLGPHGFCFGPDVATSSRATLGGMIANNSSGARAPLYGTTLDHVLSLEVVTPDGVVHTLGAGMSDMGGLLERVRAKALAHREEIETRFHDEICKRWPGYGLDRYLRSLDAQQSDAAQLIGGSEGTLGVVYAATLRVSPLPRSTGLALLFFGTVEEAMDASVSMLDLSPASVEHMDDILFDQTRGQRTFQAARDLLELDAKPCRSILLVEFYEDIADRIAEVVRRAPGIRLHVCATPREKALVWHLRKAGLSLLTGCPGSAKPTAGVEDVSVPPRHLPEYVAALRSVMARLDLRASFYGHAASGLLHVRPVLDLRDASDLRKYRLLADEVSALTRQFRGSLTAEHGVGIARTEYVREHVGDTLLDLMRAVKEVFDPKNLMNPGKIFDDGRWRIDANLRRGAPILLPFEPQLGFEAKDHSFLGNLDQCNGCGGCRKDAPVMCPTYQATGDESMSTRGRANLIRAVLEGRTECLETPLRAEELEIALEYCLACKACAVECPSNVNMALLKAELIHARHRRHGIPFSARLLSRVDLLGVVGSAMPGLANAVARTRLFRVLLRHAADFAPERPIPAYADQRFDHWFHRRPASTSAAAVRGSVLLWDDCFVRHNEPHIGKAAVAILEAAGYHVHLIEGRACCGRPAFSMGRLDLARRFGTKNLALLRDSDLPILFLEPSCYAMFREEYIELGLDGARDAAQRAVLFEQFVDLLLRDAPEALPLNPLSGGLAVHAHCHAKALADTGAMAQLAHRISGGNATLLDCGCCGMAGAFGALASRYELSIAVAGGLKTAVEALPDGTRLVASGTSCRHQLTHLGLGKPLHFAEALALCLTPGTVTSATD